MSIHCRIFLKNLTLQKAAIIIKKTIYVEDKYFHLRKRIIQLFHKNRDIFGYRRIHTLLHREGIKVSEKVVRRIMKQEKLTIRQKYNSYKSEITPSVEDIIDRDFRTTKPNQKWLTDITEFSIKAGKVYLSPIID